MAKKSKIFEHYQAFEAWLKTQYNIQIKKLRSDWGGEYLSGEFSDHLQKEGTIRQLTIHDTPEYNGVSERLNRTLLEKVRTMSQKPIFSGNAPSRVITHLTVWSSCNAL